MYLKTLRKVRLFPRRQSSPKLLLYMRFTAIILLATALQVSATGMAQKVTLHYENVPVKKYSGRSFARQECLLFTKTFSCNS